VQTFQRLDEHRRLERRSLVTLVALHPALDHDGRRRAAPGRRGVGSGATGNGGATGNSGAIATADENGATAATSAGALDHDRRRLPTAGSGVATSGGGGCCCRSGCCRCCGGVPGAPGAAEGKHLGCCTSSSLN
jgi:hypothetical protein